MASLSTIAGNGAALLSQLTVSSGTAPTTSGDDIIFSTASSTKLSTPVVDGTNVAWTARFSTAQTSRIRYQDASSNGPGIQFLRNGNTINSEEWTSAGSTTRTSIPIPSTLLISGAFVWLRITHLSASSQIKYEYANDNYGVPGTWVQIDLRALPPGMTSTSIQTVTAAYSSYVDTVNGTVPAGKLTASDVASSPGYAVQSVAVSVGSPVSGVRTGTATITLANGASYTATQYDTLTWNVTGAASYTPAAAGQAPTVAITDPTPAVNDALAVRATATVNGVSGTNTYVATNFTDGATLAAFDDFNRPDTGANGGLGTAVVGGAYAILGSGARIRNDSTTGNVSVAELAPAGTSGTAVAAYLASLTAGAAASGIEIFSIGQLASNPASQTASVWAGSMVAGASAMANAIHSRITSRAPNTPLGQRGIQVRQGAYTATTTGDANELLSVDDPDFQWTQTQLRKRREQFLPMATGMLRYRCKTWLATSPEPLAWDVSCRVVTPTTPAFGAGLVGLYANNAGSAGTWQFTKLVVRTGLAADPTTADASLVDYDDISAQVNILCSSADTAMGLDVALDSAFTQNVRQIAGVATSANANAASIPVNGLAAGTKYYYRARNAAGFSPYVQGSFTTLPAGSRSGQATSFSFTAASCIMNAANSANQISLSPVFEAVAAEGVLLHIMNGDIAYWNSTDTTVSGRTALMTALLRRNYGKQAAMFANLRVPYTPDDHDHADNDSDVTSGTSPAVATVVRECFPQGFRMPAAGSDSGNYWYEVIGRVRVIYLDGRCARSPKTATDDSTKTMLGATQKAWFKNQLLSAQAAGQFIVVSMPDPWTGGATSLGSTDDYQDTWGGYTTERAELQSFITSNNLAGCLLMVSGDNHSVSYYPASGTGANQYGGFAIVEAGMLDQHAVTRGDVPFYGPFPPDTPATFYASQYVRFDVTDNGGPSITIRAVAKRIDRVTGGVTTLFDTAQASVPIVLTLPAAPAPTLAVVQGTTPVTSLTLPAAISGGQSIETDLTLSLTDSLGNPVTISTLVASTNPGAPWLTATLGSDAKTLKIVVNPAAYAPQTLATTLRLVVNGVAQATLNVTQTVVAVASSSSAVAAAVEAALDPAGNVTLDSVSTALVNLAAQLAAVQSDIDGRITALQTDLDGRFTTAQNGINNNATGINTLAAQAIDVPTLDSAVQSALMASTVVASFASALTQIQQASDAWNVPNAVVARTVQIAVNQADGTPGHRVVSLDAAGATVGISAVQAGAPS